MVEISPPEIWIVAEPGGERLPDCTLEALGEGRSLLSGEARLCVLLLDGLTDARLRELACRSVDLLGCLEGLSSSHDPEESAAALTSWTVARAPRLILFSATPFGQETAARLSVRLGKSLVSGAVQVSAEGERYRCSVPVYGGKAQSAVMPGGDPPWIVTLLPDAIGVETPQARLDPQIISFSPAFDVPSPRIRRMGEEICDPAVLDIREAERIVAGGRGLGDAAGWRMLETLAAALEAAPAGSRAALDLGLIGRERLVGQTGKQVRPRLYLAGGISGSHYHLRAVLADTIIAINPDRSAPIFKDCQLGLVGRFEEIVPHFLDRVRAGDLKPPAAHA